MAAAQGQGQVQVPPVAPAGLDIEAFNDQAARAKSALNPLFLLAMAAYPLAIGFTTAVKNGRMVVRPLPLAGSATPSGAPPPPSPTNPGGHSLAMTCFSFTVVLMAHLILVAHILMKRPVGASEMRKSYAAAAPLLMTFFTIGYYINYLGLTRNDAFVIEWIIFSVFSAATIFMSCFVYVVPVRQEYMVRIVAPDAPQG